MWETLEKALREMWDNDEFIQGMKLYLPTEENKEEMLTAIQKGWVKTDEEAVLYSVAIYHDEPFEDEDEEENDE